MLDGQTLKIALDIAVANLIFNIQEQVGYKAPISVEVIEKKAIRWGLRYTIEVKLDDGVTV